MEGSGRHNSRITPSSHQGVTSDKKLTTEDYAGATPTKKTSKGRTITVKSPDDDTEFSDFAAERHATSQGKQLEKRTTSEVPHDKSDWTSFDQKADDTTGSFFTGKELQAASNMKEQPFLSTAPWNDPVELPENYPNYDEEIRVRYAERAIANTINKNEAKIEKLLTHRQKNHDMIQDAVQRSLMDVDNKVNSSLDNKFIKALEAQNDSLEFKTQLEVDLLQSEIGRLNKQSVHRRSREVKWQQKAETANKNSALQQNAREQQRKLLYSQDKLDNKNLNEINALREKLKTPLLEKKEISLEKLRSEKSTAENEIHWLHSKIRSRKEKVDKQLKAIDEQLQQDIQSLKTQPLKAQLPKTEPLFKVENKWKWPEPETELEHVVYSDKNMPFTIIPNGEVSSLNSTEDSRINWQDVEGFSESAPLLTKNVAFEPKLDEQGKPVLKLDENGLHIPMQDEQGNAVTEIVKVTNFETKLVTLKTQPRYEYEPDLSKPVYSYNANTDPARSVNKKKISQYNIKSFTNRIKSFFGKIRKYYRESVFSASAKAQRTIDRLLLNSKHIFHENLQNPLFSNLFKQLHTQQYKQNVTGLQKLHDLTYVMLSTKIKFTSRESQGKYKDAMATLLLVGSGVMNGRAEEGDEFAYHSLDSPVEQIIGQSLSGEAIPAYQMLQMAQKLQGRKWAGTIKSKHLKRIGKLMNEAVKAKEAVEEANKLASSEGRKHDVQDPDEVAKQTLINLVMAKAGDKMPTDLQNKLEAMRDNALWALSNSNVSDESVHEILPPSARQAVPTPDEIKVLKGEKKELTQRLKKAKSFEQENQGAIVQKLQKQIVALKTQINELVAIREKQIKDYGVAEENIQEILNQSAVITSATSSQVTRGIMAHCGFLTPDSVTTSEQFDQYKKISKLRIAEHQQQAATEKAQQIAEYLNSGTLPTAEGVYKLLTAEPPLSATEYGRSKFTKKTPPHFLHATDCKEKLSAAFKQEELAAHENRSGKAEFNHDTVNNDVTTILEKSGRLLNPDDHKKKNAEALRILSMHVVVASGAAEFDNPYTGDASLRIIIGNENIRAEEVAHARQLANKLVTEMNRSDVQIKHLASAIYPIDKQMRSAFTAELKEFW